VDSELGPPSASIRSPCKSELKSSEVVLGSLGFCRFRSQVRPLNLQCVDRRRESAVREEFPAFLLWRSAPREAPELATLVYGVIRSTSPVPIEML
jgi:hypothetical protein